MKRMVGAFTALLAVGPAWADPPSPNTLQEMYHAINACLAPVRITKGTDVTIMFSLNRRGGLIGKPRFTHVHWVGDDAEQKASAKSLAEGLDRCFPVKISDALGAAIAGHMIAYRIQGADERGA